MIRIYPEQLATHLQIKLHSCYLLSGNETLILQESQDLIRSAAKQKNFSEHHSIYLDGKTDWYKIFGICQIMSILGSRQTLLLIFPENSLSAMIEEHLIKLSTLLHDDILLILRSPRLTKLQENKSWFKAFKAKAVHISCCTPEKTQLPRWIADRSKRMNLKLDNSANQLLCYCYEGNLLALSQTLDKLSLLYSEGTIPLPLVEKIVNDAAQFTHFNWIDSLLVGNTKRTWRILQKLKQADIEVTILLRTLQRELLLLLTIQRHMFSVPLDMLFEQHNIWQHHRSLITQALKRLSAHQLQQAVQLLTQIELTTKQSYEYSIWPALETLSMLMCGNTLPTSFIHGS